MAGVATMISQAITRPRPRALGSRVWVLREPVRRVVPSDIAARLREFLREAAGQGGTGEEAQLVNYAVLGKTGTAVRFADGHYVRGEYTASFAAIFPAEDPQLVVIVKIDNPKGRY